MKTITTLNCACCPNACNLVVDETDGGFAVTGNHCRNGELYARTQLETVPRIMTASVQVKNSTLPCAVISDKPLMRADMPAVLEALSALCVPLPIARGQMILEDACGLGVNFTAVREVR